MRFAVSVHDALPAQDSARAAEFFARKAIEAGHRRVDRGDDPHFLISTGEWGGLPDEPLPCFFLAWEKSEPKALVPIFRGNHERSQAAGVEFVDDPSRDEHVPFFLLRFLARVDDAPRPAVDEGLALLEPITQPEHAATERILNLLGEARASGRLTGWQEDQIVLMADLIRASREEAVPDETERWKVVGVVGGALRYLARELPDDVVKWGAAGVILTNVDWHALARALPG